MEDVEALLEAVVAGEAAAWHRLVELLVPRVEVITRSHAEMRRRGLTALPDDVAEVTTQVLERLSRHQHKNLERYRAQRSAADGKGAQSFDSWLYGAVDFAIREHIRGKFGRPPKPASETTSKPMMPDKRALSTNAERFDEERFELALMRTLGVTTQLTLAEISEFIAREFADHEVTAMRLYYQEERSFEEIARVLALGDAHSADKLVRRLNARLRHKFAQELKDDP